MKFSNLLIANRGEIAIRIMRSAADMASLHTRMADQALALEGRGAAAHLDIAQIMALAKRAGADAVHPGYGFLSENAKFARTCKAADIAFVGPDPKALDLFGDKSAARALAKRVGIPVLPGTGGAGRPAPKPDDPAGAGVRRAGRRALSVVWHVPDDGIGIAPV